VGREEASDPDDDPGVGIWCLGGGSRPAFHLHGVKHQQAIPARVAPDRVIPVDDQRPALAEADIVTADVEVHKTVTLGGRQVLSIEKCWEAAVQPGRADSAGGQEWLRVDGHALPAAPFEQPLGKGGESGVAPGAGELPE
jgi:hypothetical protein